jgi:hypothetical protein
VHLLNITPRRDSSHLGTDREHYLIARPALRCRALPGTAAPFRPLIAPANVRWYCGS